MFSLKGFNLWKELIQQILNTVTAISDIFSYCISSHICIWMELRHKLCVVDLVVSQIFVFWVHIWRRLCSVSQNYNAPFIPVGMWKDYLFLSNRKENYYYFCSMYCTSFFFNPYLATSIPAQQGWFFFCQFLMGDALFKCTLPWWELGFIMTGLSKCFLAVIRY